jgi:hypothetical protein
MIDGEFVIPTGRGTRTDGYRFNFCLNCNHGMHAGHAKDWFSRHKVCPVPDCECNCKM